MTLRITNPNPWSERVGGIAPADEPPRRRSSGSGQGSNTTGGQTTSNTPGAPLTTIQILPQTSPAQTVTFRTDTFIPLTNPLPAPYGPFRIGGQLAFDCRMPTTGGKMFAWLVALDQIDAITSILVEQRTLAQWGATSEVFLGDPAQASSSLLASTFFFLGASRFTKFANGLLAEYGVALAYVVALFPPPDATHSDPDPYQFLVEGRGKLVVDPTLGISATTNLPTHAKVYSANPFYCMADWVAASTKAYGCCQPQSSIDWLGTVTSSGAACDFDIGGGTKRFSIAATITAGGDPWQEIENMRAVCQGLRPVFNNGLWQFPIDIAQSSSGISFTDQGPNSNLVSAGPLVIAGPNDVKTRVRVTYTDTLNAYKVDTTPPDDDPGIAGGTVPIEEVTENIPYIPTYDQAVRIGRYRRKRYSMDKSSAFITQPDGIQLLPGLRFTIANSEDLNFSNVECISTDIGPLVGSPTGQWKGRLELYDPSLYDDTQASITSFAPPAATSPFTTPPAPLPPTLTQDGYDIIVTLNPPTPAYPFYAGQRVTYQRLGFPATLMPDNIVGPLRIVGISLGSLYTVTAQTLSTAQGVLSAASTPATVTPVLQAGMAIRDGKALTVISDRQTISYDGNSQLAPAVQTVTFTAIKQNILTTVQWSMTRTDGTVLDPSLFLSATSGDQVTMTSANFDTARGSTTGVIVSASAVELA